MLDFFDTHRDFTLFLVLGLGYLLGRVRIGPVSLGPVAGVLFVGLVLGHFEFEMSAGAQAVGFALFIFSVGHQAGPRFFDVLRKDGLRYLSLALVVGLTGASVALIVSRLAGLAFGTAGGVLAGGMTSSAALAAAQDALRSGAVEIREGSVTQAIDNAAVGYAVTYLLSLVGVVLSVKVLPRLLGIDLAAESARVARVEGGAVAPAPPPVLRAWAVTNPEILGQSLSRLRDRWDGFTWVRVQRDADLLLPRSAGTLRDGDHVIAFGDQRFMPRLQDLGEDVTAEYADRVKETQAKVILTSAEATGRTLEELAIPVRFGVFVEGLWRGGKRLPREVETHVMKGDVLEVRGPAIQVDALGDALGKVERPGDASDMRTVFLAIAAGILLGTFSIQIAGARIALGSAGGLLLAGVLVGFGNSVRPTFGRMSAGARVFIMDLGLSIFMVGVGLRAGANIVETFQDNGVVLLLCGAAVTSSAVGVGLLFAGKVLRLNPALAFGAVTGAMTSGAALSVVTSEARSDVPSLGYTGTYAFANVLLTVLGTLVLSLG